MKGEQALPPGKQSFYIYSKSSSKNYFWNSVLKLFSGPHKMTATCRSLSFRMQNSSVVNFNLVIEVNSRKSSDHLQINCTAINVVSERLCLGV